MEVHEFLEFESAPQCGSVQLLIEILIRHEADLGGSAPSVRDLPAAYAVIHGFRGADVDTVLVLPNRTAVPVHPDRPVRVRVANGAVSSFIVLTVDLRGRLSWAWQRDRTPKRSDPRIIQQFAQLPDHAKFWLVESARTGDRCPAADAMCYALFGYPPPNRSGANHPETAEDIRRCCEFLNSVPEAGLYFHQVASLSEQWTAVVAHWGELCELMLHDWPACERRLQAILEATCPRTGVAA